MRNLECPGVQVSYCRSGKDANWLVLKILLGVQIHTSTLHVLAEFGRYPLKIAWQAQAAEYLSCLETMDANRTLKQAFVADRRWSKQKSWSFQHEAQLRDVSVNVPTTGGHSHRCFSISPAQSAHIAQLSSSTSSRAATYRDVKVGYGCEPYIQQSNNRYLRRIDAQFCTGSHWLNIETGRHKKVDRSGRICPMCVGRIINQPTTQTSLLIALMPLILMRMLLIP